jgi:hypothetical protein
VTTVFGASPINTSGHFDCRNVCFGNKGNMPSEPKYQLLPKQILNSDRYLTQTAIVVEPFFCTDHLFLPPGMTV